MLAYVDRSDWVLCQITSNPYGDSNAIELRDDSFQTGSLRVVSYARPGKLFTASEGLIVAQVGILKTETLKQVIKAIIDILEAGIKP